MIHESFFNKVGCGLMVCKNDVESTVIEANDAFYSMIGYSREEFEEIYKGRFTRLVIDDLEQILQLVGSAVEGKHVLDYEYRIRHKSGRTVWIHDIAVYDSEEDVFNVAIMDITYKEKILENVSRAATIDRVTGLMNRGTLETRIKSAIEEANVGESRLIALIDLDNFKTVNDVKGHQMGDTVLSHIGEKLRSVLEEEYIVGRLGGDEFMIFFEGVESENYIRNWLEKVSRVLRLEVESIYVSASIGVVWDKKGSYNFEELYTMVDKILYKVKNNNKGRYELEIV